MKISESLEERINKMRESKNKQIWNDLKESENVYITIPTIDKVNDIYNSRKGYFRLRPLNSLKYEREYYNYVQDIYDKYDFILNQGFFQSNIHVNEVDALQITPKIQNKLNKICESLDTRIKELEELDNKIPINYY